MLCLHENPIVLLLNLIKMNTLIRNQTFSGNIAIETNFW